MKPEHISFQSRSYFDIFEKRRDGWFWAGVHLAGQFTLSYLEANSVL
jgi:hypothetical protein